MGVCLGVWEGEVTIMLTPPAVLGVVNYQLNGGQTHQPIISHSTNLRWFLGVERGGGWSTGGSRLVFKFNVIIRMCNVH